MADTRFLSFEDAMQLLSVSEDELHDLVAANELRAFRVDREMKFKEADVQSLAEAAGGGGGAVEDIASVDDIVSIDEADVVMVDVPDESGAGLEADAEIVAFEESDDSAIELAEVDEGLETIADTDEAALEEADGLEAISPAEDVVLVSEEESVPEMAGDDEAEGTVLLEDEDLVVDTPAVAPKGDETAGTILLDDSDLELDEIGADDASATQVADESATQLALDPTEDGTEPVIESATSDGLGTEEIIFEDEDLAIGSLDDEEIGTQEITVREDAVGGEELTIQEDEPGLEVAAAGAARSPARPRSRKSARRTLQVKPAKSDTFWAAVMVLTALGMIYPLMLVVMIAWQGFVSGDEAFSTGDQRHNGKINELGPVFVHRFFQGFCDMEIDKEQPAFWWGRPKEPPKWDSSGAGADEDDGDLEGGGAEDGEGGGAEGEGGGAEGEGGGAEGEGGGAEGEGGGGADKE